MRIVKAISATIHFLFSWTLVTVIRGFCVLFGFFLVTTSVAMLFGGKDIDWGTRMCVVLACFGCAVGTVWLWVFWEIRRNSDSSRLMKIFRITCYLLAGCLMPLGLYSVMTFMLPHSGRDSGLLILFFAGLAMIALGMRLFWVAFKKIKKGLFAPIPSESKSMRID